MNFRLKVQLSPDAISSHDRALVNQLQRTIPLGWIIGDAPNADMHEQLTGAEGAADNAGNTLGIVGEFE